MVTGHQWDLRPFVTWIVRDFLPSAKAGPGVADYGQSPGATRPALYGTADAACILYTLNHLDGLKPTGAWLQAIERYQDHRSGYFVDDTPILATAHNTGFAIGAMHLFNPNLYNGVSPLKPLSFAEPLRDTSQARRFFDALDWRSRCYEAGEIVTGLASTFYNVRGVVAQNWFDWLIGYVQDTKFDSDTGMVGVGKPEEGDLDQIGGTFHFDFLWATLDRTLPHPQARAKALMNLQQPNGLWDDHNPWWLTFDSVYMLGRTLAALPNSQANRVREAISKAIGALADRALDSAQRQHDFVDHWMGVHMLTGATSAFAYAQRHLFGTDTLRTDHPLQLVLDHRPYI
jgi:hypothetical protein